MLVSKSDGVIELHLLPVGYWWPNHIKGEVYAWNVINVKIYCELYIASVWQFSEWEMENRNWVT